MRGVAQQNIKDQFLIGNLVPMFKCQVQEFALDQLIHVKNVEKNVGIIVSAKDVVSVLDVALAHIFVAILLVLVVEIAGRALMNAIV